MKTYKFIYFGTPYVASDTLAVLLARGFRPEVVVTSPDAPKGRGLTLQSSPTKELAETHGLLCRTPDVLDENQLAALKEHGADYAIVVAYGKILPRTFIEAFPLGVLNVHYSLLPKYRGASPVEAALLHGDTVTGVAIQKMVYELDAGDLIATKEVAIDPNETTRELRPRLVAIGAELLADTLPGYLSGEITPVGQNHEEATRCRKIAKEEGLLDLAANAQENWNKYRAYAESPGTYFFIQKGEKSVRVKIKSATFENGSFVPLRVVPEGKNEMSYADFAR